MLNSGDGPETRSLAQLKCEPKDAGLSRAESQKFLARAGELDVKTVPAFDLVSSDLDANFDAPASCGRE